MKKLLAALLAFIMILSLHAFAEENAEEEAFATIEALQFDKEPEIDGKVSVEEWGQPTVAHIKYPENPQTDVSNDDQTDVEFTIWFRYTFEGFYIAAQAPDTSPCNDNVHDQNIWNGDCLQMRLDPYGCTADQNEFDPLIEPSSSRDKNYSDDFQEFAFAYCTDDGECYAYCWHGIMSGLALQSEGGRYSASNDGTVTTYEVFVPWDELVYDMPHVGTSYGIAAALLTATEGENDNKWQNWLEWGSGVINNRDDNICGTNRLNLVATTVFGGASLTDPDPDAEVTTRAAVSEASDDVVLIDFTKLSGENGMFHEINDDGSITFGFDEGNDPYVGINISGQVRLKAEEYPYFAIYMKTNDPFTEGELFYCASEGVSDFQANYSTPIEYYEVEGNQVVVIELGDCDGYEGYVLKLRFDAYDGGCTDPEESEITVYAAGFFKTYEDAVMFKAGGVDVELDPDYVKEVPDYVKEVSDGPSAGTDTAAEATDTSEENTGTSDTSETAAESGENTTDKTENQEKATETENSDSDKKSDNKWIIFVIIGVAAAAAIAIALVMILKNKKK